MSSRLKPLHAPLPLAGRLMGVFDAVVEVAVLAMFHPRQELALRGAIAVEFVGDDDPWHVGQALEELAEKLLRRLFIPTALHENIQDVAVLIAGPPEVMPYAMHREEYLVEVPLVARPRAATTELIRIGLSKLPAPLADSFVGDQHATDKEEFFDVPIAEAEAVVEPDAVTDGTSLRPKR
jgi:hypothetical protein